MKTKQKSHTTLLFLAALTLSGCASLHSVSVTRVPANRTNPIESEAWTWGILGLYASNDFVNEAVEKLDAQCPQGRISGIMTKYSSKFFMLWTTRTVNASGYCLSGNAK